MNTNPLQELKAIKHDIFHAILEIADVLAYEDTHHVEETVNAFGDQQLKLDVLSDQVMFESLKRSKLVKYALSEEKPELQDIGGSKYIVTFDPLDGSSIIDVNWAVGTIFAVWPGDNKLIGQTPKDICFSGIAVYGPKTCLIFYNPDTESVEEWSIRRDDQDKKYWKMTKGNIKIQDKAKIFSPANLRASSEDPKYEKLVEYWRKNKYTLRYTGGLVPDVYQIFIKGQGVFCNPTTDVAPAKLRFLYEVAPVAFIVEKAGGKTSDGKESIMNQVVKDYTSKGPLTCGSADEVTRFEEFMKRN